MDNALVLAIDQGTTNTKALLVDRSGAVIASASRPMTVDELSERMYSRQRGYPALLALTDVGARVEHLEERGRIVIADLEEVAEEACPVLRYRLA